MTYIKICGITHLEDARCASDAGADFLGFIFYPPSPRYIAPEAAGAIVAALRADLGATAPRFVGVFVDSPEARIRAIRAQAGLDFVQLHGSEPLLLLEALYPYAFKALRPQSLSEARTAFATYRRGRLTADPSAPQLLVDAYAPHQKGGTGLSVDLVIARWLASHCRLLLAGGLTPQNVGEAIAHIKPWGVDVSTGVEDVSTGVEHKQKRKDHERVRAFIRAVRATGQPPDHN